MLVRNVWGKGAFNGKWSEHSSAWSKVATEDIPPQGTGCDAEGIFWIGDRDIFRLAEYVIYWQNLRPLNTYISTKHFAYKLTLMFELK